MAVGKQRRSGAFDCAFPFILTGLEQWLAASAAGLTEFEYFPAPHDNNAFSYLKSLLRRYLSFDDGPHGDIVAEFVSEIRALEPPSLTVRCANVIGCQCAVIVHPFENMNEFQNEIL
jgi:hypothetical protein